MLGADPRLGDVGLREPRLPLTPLNGARPAALGEEVQNNWHRYVAHVPEARGWSNQLRNEPGVLLVYERRRSMLSAPVSLHISSI